MRLGWGRSLGAAWLGLEDADSEVRDRRACPGVRPDVHLLELYFEGWDRPSTLPPFPWSLQWGRPAFRGEWDGGAASFLVGGPKFSALFRWSRGGAGMLQAPSPPISTSHQGLCWWVAEYFCHFSLLLFFC